MKPFPKWLRFGWSYGWKFVGVMTAPIWIFPAIGLYLFAVCITSMMDAWRNFK